ncbi:RNA polymerase sigma factor [Streptomyces filamentosus]
MNSNISDRDAGLPDPQPERPQLPKKFDAFIREHKDDFYKTALTRLIDPRDADEALNDAFLLIYQKWERVEAHPKPVAMARFMLSCKIRDFHRSRARLARREQSVAEPPDTSYLDEMGHQDSLGRALEELRTSSPRQADCWEMHKILGKTYDEIARELDITSGAAKTSASKAQARLKELLTLQKEKKDS